MAQASIDSNQGYCKKGAADEWKLISLIDSRISHLLDLLTTVFTPVHAKNLRHVHYPLTTWSYSQSNELGWRDGRGRRLAIDKRVSSTR